MKKLVLFLVAILTVGVLAACGSTVDEAAKTEEKTTASEQTKEELKAKRTALLAYQASVNKLIRDTTSNISAGEQTPSEVAAAFEEELNNLVIAEELEAATEGIEKASSELVQYFNKMAELIEAGNEDMTETETFQEAYITEVTNVFESVELSAPNFSMIF